MLKRIVLGTFVVATLTVLIFYSQYRVAPPFVSGMIETDEIRLGSRVGGRVKAVFVDEGDHVESGTPLIEFEPYDLLEREQQSVAELAARDADLRRLKAGLRPEEIGQARLRVERLAAQLKLLELGPRQEEIDAARERVKASKAEALLANLAYDRLAKLMQSNSIPQSEFDIAKERNDAATSNVEVKKSELAILEAGARPEEIIQATAQVNEAQLAWELAKQGFRVEEIEQAAAARAAAAAALEIVRRQKTELAIAAPEPGYVDALDLQPGDLVGPNAPFMTILPDRRMWVRAYVPQHFLQLAIGQKLKLTIDSFPDEAFHGVVSFISHQSEFTPSNVQTADDRAKQVYRVRVTISEKTEKLRSGMTANVWLTPINDGGDE